MKTKYNVLNALFDIKPSLDSDELERASLSIQPTLDLRRPRILPRIDEKYSLIDHREVVPQESPLAAASLTWHEYYQPPTDYPWVASGNVKLIPSFELMRGEHVRSLFATQIAAAETVPLRVARKRKDTTVADRMLWQSPTPPRRVWGFWLIGIVTFTVLSVIGSVGFVMATNDSYLAKHDIVTNATLALHDMEDAAHYMKQFEFGHAADSFALAADGFKRAENVISGFRASVYGILRQLPVFQKATIGVGLLSIGEQSAQAGHDVAQALQNLSQINVLSYAGDARMNRGQSLSEPVAQLKDALGNALWQLGQAKSSLADVDPSLIPEDKRALFSDYVERLPELEAYLKSAQSYSDDVIALVGAKTTKNYIVLLENNTELRPAGGFPGSYAVISLDHGVLTNFFVDDVYNIDGQNKVNIRPPRQIEHITPNWGMRDANWFADFPLSARKVMDAYENDGGARTDGVIALTPIVIAKLLKLTGPVDMPEYGVTLTADNFVASIQNQVEYGDKAQPKKILVDFEPRFVALLAKLPKEKITDVLQIFQDAVMEKQLLAYFKDSTLEDVVIQHHASGEVERVSGDYLQIAFSNVKGFKSDAVTKNSYRLETAVRDQTIEHTLTILREHTGGKTPYKFYNMTNESYVRVYVPKGSSLTSIDGASKVTHTPLVNADALGFKTDPDLSAIEDSVFHPFPNVDVSIESDKTVFGFWIVTKPQQKSAVIVRYTLPPRSDITSSYSLLWQKQAGTINDAFAFNYQSPDGKTISAPQNSNAVIIGNLLTIDSDLTTDREIKIGLR